MKKFGVVFIFLYFSAILISVPGAAATPGKSASTDPLTLQIGPSNRSTLSTSRAIQVPPNREVSNSVQLQVGRLEEIDFVGMQGETITRAFNLMLPTGNFQVSLEKKNFDLNSSLLTIQPKEFVLNQSSQRIRMKLEIPESTEPGEYGGRMKILRKSNGERIGELKVSIKVLERLVEPLNFQESTIQRGGTYYRWYRTLPDAEIRIGSDLLKVSQPDRRGLFYLRINTSRLLSRFGWSDPRQIYTVNFTLDGVIKKNGKAEKVNDGLDFTLTILPREHSTTWSLEREESAGGKAFASVKAGKRTKFTTEYDTKNLLRLVKERETGVSAGTGGSLFSAQIGPVGASLLGAGASGKLSYLSGISNRADYDGCSAEARVESGLHILKGMLSTLKPLGGKVLTFLLNRPQYIHREYRSSGVRLETRGNANLLKANLKLGKEAEARAARFQIGGHGERSGSYLYTNYSNKPLESHSFTSSQSYGAGASGQFLGNNLLKLGPSDGSETELRFDNHTDRNRITADLATVSSDGRSVHHLGKVGEEEIYMDTLQKIGSQNFIVHSSRAWLGDVNELLLDGREINKTVVKDQKERVGLYVPVKLEVGGLGFSLAEGATFRRSNQFLSGRYRVTRTGEELPLKVYRPRNFEPVRNLSRLISYSLRPMNFSDMIHITTKSLLSGRLTFPSGSLETDRASGNFTIKTYSPFDLSTKHVSSDYLLTLSGSGFARSNVTEIQPEDFRDFEGNITLDYMPEEGGASCEIYRWNSTQDAWTPVGGTVDEGKKEVSSGIDGPGSYVVGVDKTAPRIEGKISTRFTDNLTFSLQISDNGTGVNTSSILVLVDEERLNFTYSVPSGALSVNHKISTGNHTLTVEVRDTSGNVNSLHKEVRIVKVPKTANLSVRLSHHKLLLDWSYEEGTYPIDHFFLLRDGEFLLNRSATSFNTSNTNSSLFAVFPVDKKGFVGAGKTYLFSRPEIVPRFNWDWNGSLRPATGIPIRFNASPSKVLNGSFDTTIGRYRWKFLNATGDLIAQKSGRIVQHGFTSSGRYNVTLNVTDERNRSSFFTKDIFIEDLETNETTEPEPNVFLDAEEAGLSGIPGSILRYEITLENRGNVKDLINLSRVISPWPWALTEDGEKVEIPFPSQNLSQHLLPPGKVENLTLLVKVPQSGPREAKLELQAWSWVDSDVSDSLALFASRLEGDGEDGHKGGGSNGGGGGGAASSFSGPSLNEPTGGTSKNQSVQDSNVRTEGGGEGIKKNESEKDRNVTKSTAGDTPTGRFLDSPLPFLVAGMASVLLIILLFRRFYI